MDSKVNEEVAVIMDHVGFDDISIKRPEHLMKKVVHVSSIVPASLSKKRKTVLVRKNIASERESETHFAKGKQSLRTSKALIDPFIHDEKNALSCDFHGQRTLPHPLEFA